MNNDNLFFYKYKTLIIAILLSFLLLIASVTYFNYVQTKKDLLESNIYKYTVLNMKKRLVSMIEQKKSATLSIGLSVAIDEDLKSFVLHKNPSPVKYKKLIANLRQNTYYKNIWIQILDKDGHALFQSWRDTAMDSSISFMQDIKSLMQTKQKVLSYVQVGHCDLSIKTIVALYDKEKFIGALEVISHFNSISKALNNSGIASVILVNKENTKKIKYPFTNLSLKNHYIANLDAPLPLRRIIKAKGTKHYLQEGYALEEEYLRVSYLLKDNKNNELGTYIMFKKVSGISTTGLNFYLFRLLSISLFIFMFVVLLIIILLYYVNKHQKKYYKNIIDSSTNIVIVNDGNKILSVNKVFFKYFNTYKTLNQFRAEQSCICELFDTDPKYLQKTMDKESWIEYLINRSGESFIVKILFDEKVYYFSIFASLVSETKSHYSITLSDITKEEKYKQELEHLTITDTLTSVGNRRYFQTRIEEEIAKAYRYKQELSIIIFDIDKFKNVNDTYGHSVGDEILIEYAAFVRSKLRSGDEFCRIGGEEFIIIVPHTNLERATLMAEKLRRDIEMHKKILPLTMSFGVTEYKEGDLADELFTRVDKALYQAKESGRNRVCIG